jgi:Na+/glutamate symporter
MKNVTVILICMAVGTMVSGWIEERITWLESVTKMERVLRPCVVSINLPSFLASSRRRFMGEEDGLTMETTLLART